MKSKHMRRPRQKHVYWGQVESAVHGGENTRHYPSVVTGVRYENTSSKHHPLVVITIRLKVNIFLGACTQQQQQQCAEDARGAIHARRVSRDSRLLAACNSSRRSAALTIHRQRGRQGVLYSFLRMLCRFFQSYKLVFLQSGGGSAPPQTPPAGGFAPSTPTRTCGPGPALKPSEQYIQIYL